LLSENALRDSGYFNPEVVASLAGKAQSGAKLSEVGDMALVGILSTQLVHRLFVKGFELPAIKPQKSLKIVDRVLVSN
jgi:hypothetical protein